MAFYEGCIEETAVYFVHERTLFFCILLSVANFLTFGSSVSYEHFYTRAILFHDEMGNSRLQERLSSVSFYKR
jgi:hypothetical protein